jgi:hypothetical protein
VRGPFLDKQGNDLVDGGGETVYGSNGDVFAPGGQGIMSDLTGDILYYHYRECPPYPFLPNGSAINVSSQFLHQLRIRPSKTWMEPARIRGRLACRRLLDHLHFRLGYVQHLPAT